MGVVHDFQSAAGDSHTKTNNAEKFNSRENVVLTKMELISCESVLWSKDWFAKKIPKLHFQKCTFNYVVYELQEDEGPFLSLGRQMPAGHTVKGMKKLPRLTL